MLLMRGYLNVLNRFEVISLYTMNVVLLMMDNFEEQRCENRKNLDFSEIGRAVPF